MIVETDERPDISLDDERRRYYRLTPLGRRVAAAEIAAARVDRRDGAGEEARGHPWPEDDVTPGARSWTDRLFRALLRVFPFDFRADHGRDMEQTLRDAAPRGAPRGRVTRPVRLWLDMIRDVFTTAPREHVAILRQDVGYALRALRRAPVFAASAVLTLALGMSAMTGMFADRERGHVPAAAGRSSRAAHLDQQPHGRRRSCRFRTCRTTARETPVLADAIGYVPRPASLNVDGRRRAHHLELVTDNYFSMLGVQPAAGRLIQPNEGRARGDAPVVVLAYEYWQSRFGGDPAVVGRTVRLNGRPFTVIGVASRRFAAPSRWSASRRTCPPG